MSLQEVSVSSVLIPLFYQQPLLFGIALSRILPAGPDQCESSPQLETAHLDVQLAAANGIGGIPTRRVNDCVLAAIPNDNYTGAVIAFWNNAFEIAIFNRVVFDHHRQPAFLRIELRAF